MRAIILAVSALVCSIVLAVVAAAPVFGVERYFSGSAQLDYLAIVTRTDGRAITLDGFTTELSLRVDADVTDDLRFGAKVCYGCHGFEIGSAYADYRFHDAFSIRVGRFLPAFGDFPDRHDPANHRTSDKPLPYDMGRMLQLRDWNMSVLPAPYVDNGLQVYGTVEMGDVGEFDWAVYAVGGMRGNTDALDVDFIQSRSPALYFVDNNSQPAFGGRLSLSFRLGETGNLTLGASGMYGTYDPDNELDYLVLGADLVLRVEKWVLRMEYLVRRTKMALSDTPEARFRYGPGADGKFDPYQLKSGWYLETEYPVGAGFELLGRFDGMYRVGNVSQSSALRAESLILRYTLALSYRVVEQFRIKLSGEFYEFSDFDDEAAIHLGLVGAF